VLPRGMQCFQGELVDDDGVGRVEFFESGAVLFQLVVLALEPTECVAVIANDRCGVAGAACQPGAALGAASDPEPEQASVHVLPTPVTFAGMPAARWWEFEDGDVDLTSLRPVPEDTGRMLFTEFALSYGNDFF
jgi:hypothetical protein